MRLLTITAADKPCPRRDEGKEATPIAARIRRRWKRRQPDLRSVQAANDACVSTEAVRRLPNSDRPRFDLV